MRSFMDISSLLLTLVSGTLGKKSGMLGKNLSWQA